MHSNNYTLMFTAILTIVLGFFVSTADSSLKEMREKNIEADIRKNILSSLGFEELEQEPWTNEKVDKMFSQSIVGFVIDSAGNVIEDKDPRNIDPEIDYNQFPIYKRVLILFLSDIYGSCSKHLPLGCNVFKSTIF